MTDLKHLRMPKSVLSVAKPVHLALLDALLHAIDWPDTALIQDFIIAFPCVGLYAPNPRRLPSGRSSERPPPTSTRCHTRPTTPKSQGESLNTGMRLDNPTGLQPCGSPPWQRKQTACAKARSTLPPTSMPSSVARAHGDAWSDSAWSRRKLMDPSK